MNRRVGWDKPLPEGVPTEALVEMVKTGRLPIGGELRGIEFHPLVIEKVRGLL